MAGPTTQGMDDLIALDPNAYWDSDNKVRQHASIRARVSSPSRCSIPVYYESGKHNGRNASFKFVNYLGFFIEKMQGNEVIGRITPIGGLRKGSRLAGADGRISRGRFDWCNRNRHGTTSGSSDRHARRRIQAAGRPVAARRAAFPSGIVEGRATAEGVGPDLVVVDIRSDASSGMAAIERLRAGTPAWPSSRSPTAADPDLILQAMRAGANEFFPGILAAPTRRRGPWRNRFTAPSAGPLPAREAAPAGARPPCMTLVFLGAKGGAGTTTRRRELRASSSRG